MCYSDKDIYHYILQTTRNRELRHYIIAISNTRPQSVSSHQTKYITNELLVCEKRSHELALHGVINEIFQCKHNGSDLFRRINCKPDLVFNPGKDYKDGNVSSDVSGLEPAFHPLNQTFVVT